METQAKQKPMRSIWRSLLWKEWHEHKWKLALLTFLVLLVPMLFYRGGLQFLLVALGTVLFCYSILAGLFVGMSTAANENGRGTMPFLQTMPVSIRKPAVVKLLMSLMTVILPVLVVFGLAYVYFESQNISPAELAEIRDWHRGGPFGSWEIQNWLVAIGLGSVLCVTSLLLWMAAMGVNRSDEIRAGAAGFLIMATVWLGLYLGLFLILLTLGIENANGTNTAYVFQVVMAAAPGGPAFASNFVGSLESSLPYVVVALVGHGCLFVWFVRRFGRQAVRPARTAGGLAKVDHSAWLAPPRRSQLTAIAWKQFWETGPLSLIAAGAILAMSALHFLIDSERPIRESYGEVLGGIAIMIGFLVTLVTGMGVFLEDLKPKIDTFWRSRPVNYSLWFGVKYLTGLFVLIAVFGSLALLAYLTQDEVIPFASREFAVAVTYFVLIFLWIYTLAMAVYCLLRQPVISGLVSMTLLFCGVFAFTALDEVFLTGMDVHWSVGIAILLAVQGFLTVTAWLAVRNDWGWHNK